MPTFSLFSGRSPITGQFGGIFLPEINKDIMKATPFLNMTFEN
jgi:hypothetical protein